MMMCVCDGVCVCVRACVRACVYVCVWGGGGACIYVCLYFTYKRLKTEAGTQFLAKNQPTSQQLPD